MKARKGYDVRIRQDTGFGGIIYVHHRNDFFAADIPTYQKIKYLSDSFVEIPQFLEEPYRKLAELGICETIDPATKELPYSGPSFLGTFYDIPSVEKPLVINCFATSFCPLSCIYCHADDLMKEYRKTETSISDPKEQVNLRNVMSTTMMVPAMVAVLTGGDPLTRPDRTITLIEGLAKQKTLVLDTSGFGDISLLIFTLKKYDVHVRVSLDSLSRENDTWRILNPQYKQYSSNLSPRENALMTIRKCLDSGLGVTVQTVVHANNDNYDQLIDLRDGLINLGVKNWVLHIAISGGLARKKERDIERTRKARGRVLPGDHVRADIGRLIENTIKDQSCIDIRCTDNNSTPNSVLLVNSEGNLFTEGLAHNGKLKLFDVHEDMPEQFRSMFSYVDWLGHARRYLNWNPWYFNHKNFEDVCYQIHSPKPRSVINLGLSKTEKKYKIANLNLLMDFLREYKATLLSKVKQIDEYYDTQKGNLSTFNYILRIRREFRFETNNESMSVNFIVPLFFAETGEYKQFELGFSISNREELYNEMERMGLDRIWCFEKTRQRFTIDQFNTEISMVEIPEMGYFLELEGLEKDISALEKIFLDALGSRENRNYRDLYITYKLEQGTEICGIIGPRFTNFPNW